MKQITLHNVGGPYIIKYPISYKEGLIPSVKGLQRKRLRSPQAEAILPPDRFQAEAASPTLPLASSLLAYPEELGLATCQSPVP